MINCENCRRYKKSCTGGLEKEQCEKIRLPQTNADRIRAMTDEEMAEEIKAIVCHCANGFCGKGCPLYSLCYSQGITELDWLKQEVNEDG